MFHCAIDCSDDSRLLVLSEENAGQQQLDFNPYHAFRFIDKMNGKVGSTGKIRRQSVQLNPELKTKNIGGIIYVIRNAVCSGAFTAAGDAIASRAERMTVPTDYIQVGLTDSTTVELSWDMDRTMSYEILFLLYRPVAYYPDQRHQLEFTVGIQDARGVTLVDVSQGADYRAIKYISIRVRMTYDLPRTCQI